jgi:hypothetical protein
MEQLTLDIQRELCRLKEDAPTIVTIPNTKVSYSIGWIKNKTVRKITKVLNEKAKDPSKEDVVLCKAMALIVLNGFWKIMFFYPILWRWFAYVKQYDDYQILPVIEEAKKKVPQIPYLLSMTYLQGLKDTLATMTREEVERMRHEQR